MKQTKTKRERAAGRPDNGREDGKALMRGEGMLSSIPEERSLQGLLDMLRSALSNGDGKA